MSKDSIIINAGAPETIQVVLNGVAFNALKDPRIIPASQNIEQLRQQGAEALWILYALLNELFALGILKAPAPPPGSDEVGKPVAPSALDALLGEPTEVPDSEKPTVPINKEET